jgi:hypothetical protein
MGRWGRCPAWGALAALVLVVPILAAGCTIRARPEPTSTTAAAEELAEDRSVSVVPVFPLLGSPPRCVRRVELWLRVLRFDHRQAVPVLAAYLSLLTSLATDRPPPGSGTRRWSTTGPAAPGP